MKDLLNEIKKYKLNKAPEITPEGVVYHIKPHQSFKGHHMRLTAQNKNGEMLLTSENFYFNNSIIQIYSSKHNSTLTKVVFNNNYLPKWYKNKWIEIEKLKNCRSAKYSSEFINVSFESLFGSKLVIKSVHPDLYFNQHDTNISLIKDNRHLNKKMIYNFKHSDISEWESLSLNKKKNIILLPNNIIK